MWAVADVTARLRDVRGAHLLVKRSFAEPIRGVECTTVGHDISERMWEILLGI